MFPIERGLNRRRIELVAVLKVRMVDLIVEWLTAQFVSQIGSNFKGLTEED